MTRRHDSDELTLAGFLKSEDGRGLEAEVRLVERHECVSLSRSAATTHLEVLRDFTNKPLEGKFPDQEFGRFLVTSDFTKGDSSRPEPVRLLDTSSRRLR